MDFVIEAIAYIGAELQGEIGATLIMNAESIAYAVVTAAAVATVQDQQRRAEHMARDAYNRSQKDRYVMVRGALEPRRIVLGQRRNSGPMFFVGSYGVDREHLVFLVALAGHEVADIPTIYFDDEPIILDGAGNVIGILRTEQFSIATSSDTFNIQTDPESGSVSAVAYYGTTQVVLSVSVSGKAVTVSGAHSGEVGRVEISYRPSPNPFKPVNYASTQESVVATGSSQNFTLSHTPEPSSVSVAQIVGDSTESLAFTLSGAVVTFTGTSGYSVVVNYQWASANSLARVRRYYGRQDQAADAGLIASLPDFWTSAHRAAGVAYLVVELDYDREAFSGGIPNVSAIVKGLKCYDPRKNKVPNPLMTGAVPGAPGTLPTGWAQTVGNGVSSQVIGSGTDAATGWPYLDIQFSGTATATSTIFLTPVPFAAGVTASAGQSWSARCMVRRLSGMAWTSWAFARLNLVSYDSGGTATTESIVAISAAQATGHQDPIEVTDVALVSGATRVGMRLALGYTSGQVVDCTIRFMLPQLWQGAVGAATDCNAWTENPALQVAGYATNPLGGRLPWDQVDIASLVSEANVCDTTTTYTVDGADYVRPLYTSGYVALTDQMPKDVLNELCSAMGGEWCYSNGVLKQRAGAWRAPVLTLDESWLLGSEAVQIQPAIERDKYFNCVRGSFVDERQAYRSVPFSPIEPDTYISADGAKLPLDVEYNAISFDGQAQYVASCAARRAQQGLTLTVKCNLRAWQAEKFDNLYVNLDRYGFSNKTFEVMRDGFTLDGGIALVLRESGPSTWDMDAGFPASDPEPNSRLSDPWAIPPLTGLTAESGNAQLLLLDDGSIISRVKVTWDTVTDPRVLDSTGTIEVDWKPADATQWQTIRVPGSSPQAYIAPAPDRTLIVIRARAVGSIGKSPDTVQISHQVLGKSAAPSTITGFTQSILYGAIRLEWDQTTDLDYAQTELRAGGTDWASATPLLGGTQPTLIRGNKFDWAWPAFGSYTVRARNHDTSGNVGTTSALVGVVVDDRIKLGSNGIDVDLAGINLVINSSFERDSNGDGLADNFASYVAGMHGTATYSQVAGRIQNLAQRVDVPSLGSTSSDRVGFRQFINIGAGAIQNLVATAWLRASANMTTRLYVELRNSGGTTIASQSATLVSDGSTWTRPAVYFTNVSATAVEVVFYVWIESRSSGTSCWLQVDDVQVEEATVPSSWHPYPGESSVRVWYQATDPGSAAKDNDEWINTSDNRVYVRLAGVWVFKRNVGDGDIDTDQLADDAATDVFTYAEPTSPVHLGSSTATVSSITFTTLVANERVISTVQYDASVSGTAAASAVGQTGADNGFMNTTPLYDSTNTVVSSGNAQTFSQTGRGPYTIRSEWIVATPGTYTVKLNARGASGLSLTRDFYDVKFAVEGIKK